VDFFYLNENNGIVVEWHRRFMEPGLFMEAAGSAKRGKCFHTGNMGFPQGGGCSQAGKS
jgi:hypothetical protein